MSMRVSKFEKFKTIRKESASAGLVLLVLLETARNCLKLQEAPRSSKKLQGPPLRALHRAGAWNNTLVLLWPSFAGLRKGHKAPNVLESVFLDLFRSYLCQDDGRWRLDLVDSSGWLGSCPVKWLVTQLLGWNPSRRPTDLLWYIYIYIHIYIYIFWFICNRHVFDISSCMQCFAEIGRCLCISALVRLLGHRAKTPWRPETQEPAATCSRVHFSGSPWRYIWHLLTPLDTSWHVLISLDKCA